MYRLTLFWVDELFKMVNWMIRFLKKEKENVEYIMCVTVGAIECEQRVILIHLEQHTDLQVLKNKHTKHKQQQQPFTATKSTDDVNNTTTCKKDFVT